MSWSTVIAWRSWAPRPASTIASLRKELARAVHERSEINGRSVCLVLRVLAGGANFVTKSIPSLVQVLRELSYNAEFRATWVEVD